MREALRERGLLLDVLAPHLVRPVPFLYPLTKPAGERPYVGAGLVLYDTMGGATHRVPRHKHLTKRGALRLAPGLQARRADRRRSTTTTPGRRRPAHLTVARTAAAYGAAVAHLDRRSSASCARASGSSACGSRDVETGDEIEVRGHGR